MRPFEISISAENGNGDQAVVLDGRADVLFERAAVADARGAAVADQLEAELVEIFSKARGFQIIGDHFRTGREAGLHPGLAVQTAFDGLLRQQAGPQHQGWVRSIRAAGDRRDDHRTVRKFELVAIVLHRDVLLRGAFERLFERRFRLPQRHAILRALRPGQRGLDAGEIEFELVGVDRIRRGIGAEDALRLRVFLDEAHARFVAAREAQIGKRLRIHGEEAHRRAVFGRHVGDRRAVRQAQAGKPRAVELDEFSDHAFFAQHFGDDQHEVGGRRAFGQTAVQLEADDFRDQHRQAAGRASRPLLRCRQRPSRRRRGH